MFKARFAGTIRRARVKRCAVVSLAGRALLAALLTGPAAADEIIFHYLQRDGDPWYTRNRAYTGLQLRDRYRPLAGAKLAIRESRIVGRALGHTFQLAEHALDAKSGAVAAVERLMREADARLFLLDLPLADVEALSTRFGTADVLLFNIRHAETRLRSQDCAATLFHTPPSNAMLMDGLAQFLVQKRWRAVLVLVGEHANDRVLATAFERSAQKFGLDVVAVKDFVLGNDPRQRYRNNVALLTSGVEYDVVVLADTVGEFGRYVPFNTQRARPVVGTEGLTASAWHWTWERHGAPQLNQRFDKIAKRRMSATDYAAWIAIKSVVEAVKKTRSPELATLRAALTSDALTVDTYKGAPGTFRPWNRQLRQAVLLATHNAVTARAPLPGFLHQHNELDTLGLDRADSTCSTP